MIFSIQIDDNKLTSFTDSSKNELKVQLTGIADGIVDEAVRIERSERGDGNNGEIVRNDVEKAASLFTRFIEQRKGKKKYAFFEIISSLSGLLAGLFLPMYDKHIICLIAGVMFLLLASMLSMYLIINKV